METDINKKAADLKFSYEMIEDYLLSAIPPVADNLKDKMIAVQKDPNFAATAELITVDNTGKNILRLYPSEKASSGWAKETIAVPAAPDKPINKLLTFYELGMLYVMAHYRLDNQSDRVVVVKKTGDEKWAGMKLPPNLSKVMQTDVYRDDKEQHYFYGISKDYIEPTFFIASEDSAGQWKINFLEKVDNPATTTYRIFDGLNGNQMTIVKIDGPKITYRSGGIGDDEMFQYASDPGGSFDLQKDNLQADQIIPFPHSQGRDDFLYLAKNNELYYIQGFAQKYPKSIYLTGQAGQPKAIKAVSLGLDGQNLYMLFAIDNEDNSLWLLRQTDTMNKRGVENEGVVFGNWVQLGSKHTDIACPERMKAGPEIFSVDFFNRNVNHLQQNPASGSWFNKVLETPVQEDAIAAAKMYKSTYATEITAVDENDNPVSAVEMEITADRPTVIYVNGLSYHVDSQAKAPVKTDLFGRLTVVSEALNLTAPTLNIQFANSMGSVVKRSVRADLHVHERMSGKNPQFPVDGKALKGANLIPNEADKDASDNVAGCIRNVGSILASAQSNFAGNSSGDLFNVALIDDVCWEIDFTNSRKLPYRSLSQKEFQSYLNSMEGEVGSWISDVWGDVAHAIKNGAKEIERFVVNIRDNIANVAVQIAGKIKNFILNSIEQIGDLVECVFHKIAEAFKKIVDAIKTAIEWLKMLFKWNDILNTKKVIEFYINSVFTNIVGSLDDAAESIEKRFDNLKDSVATAFNNAEKVFEKGITFNQFVGKRFAVNIASGSPLIDPKLNQIFADQSVRNNFISNKVNNHVSRGGILSTGPDALSSVNSQFDDLVKMIQKQIMDPNLAESRNKFYQWWGDACKNPKLFFDMVILDFLEAIKDLVIISLDIIEDIIIAVLKLAGGAIAGLQAILNKTINIPIVSSLYKLITDGHDLTLLDLFCLIMAIPCTIVYKIIHGGSKASPPFTDDDVSKIIEMPIPWPSTKQIFTEKAYPTNTLTGSSKLDETLVISFCIISFFYCNIDIKCDIAALYYYIKPEIFPSFIEEFSSFYSNCAIICAAGLQGLGAPKDVIFKSIKSRTNADNASLWQWGAGFIPLVVDIICMCKNKKLARMQDKYGPGLDTCLGTVNLGVGIWTAVEMKSDENYNGWNIAEVIISPIPSVCKSLIYLSKSTYGVPFAILLIIDALCDLSIPVIHLAGSEL